MSHRTRVRSTIPSVPRAALDRRMNALRLFRRIRPSRSMPLMMLPCAALLSIAVRRLLVRRIRVRDDYVPGVKEAWDEAEDA